MGIEYPTELLVYDAGETRTTFIAFWKALALLQCGTCIVLITPMIYKNENQPSEYIRTVQAVGGELHTIPFVSSPCTREESYCLGALEFIMMPSQRSLALFSSLLKQ